MQRAARLARSSDAALTVVTVLHMPASYRLALGHSIGMGSEPWQALRHSCEEVLNQALELLTAQGVAAQTELKVGDPGDEIVRLAREGEFDLIVVGSRGRGTATAHLLGSVSDQISHHAPCDLLIVRSR